MTNLHSAGIFLLPHVEEHPFAAAIRLAARCKVFRKLAPARFALYHFLCLSGVTQAYRLRGSPPGANTYTSKRVAYQRPERGWMPLSAGFGSAQCPCTVRATRCLQMHSWKDSLKTRKFKYNRISSFLSFLPDYELFTRQ